MWSFKHAAEDVNKCKLYLRRAEVYVIVEASDIRDVKSQYRGYRDYRAEYNSAEFWLSV